MKFLNWFNKIICFFFKHRYHLKRRVSPTIREVVCKRCGAEFGMNDYNRILLPLDDELRQMHDDYLSGDDFKLRK